MGSTDDSSTDSSLLGRLRRDPSDPESWHLFVSRYGQRIYDWGRRLGLQDADARDVTQGVLARLLRLLPTFHYDPEGTFRGYLRRMTRNALCDFLQGPQSRERGSGNSDVLDRLNSLPAGEELADSIDEEAERELFELACRKVRLRVEPRTWQAFELFALEGLDAQEVSRRLGMGDATIYSTKLRITRMLQEEIRKLDRREGRP